MRVTRRRLLIGAAAGGGLLAVWTLLPRNHPVPLDAAPGEHAFNAWIKIGRDGVITIAVPQLEMGQGATSLFPRIAAQELGADWRQIAVEPAPVSAAYADPVLAAHWAGLWTPMFASLADEPDDTLARLFARRETLMATVSGTGIAAYERPLREAAAGVRTVLAKAAAARWDVAFEECRAEDGFIVHGQKRLRFAELVDEAAEYDPPDPPPLDPTPPSDVTGALAVDAPALFPRLDAPSKVDGSFPFAGDIRLPGMVFAAIAHGPLPRARLDTHDENAARGITGYFAKVEGEGWLAAVGSSQWAAETALRAMAPRFVAQSALIEDGAMAARLDTALADGEAQRVVHLGEPDDALSGRGALTAHYRMAPPLHATIETATAVARFEEGRLEIWYAAQAPAQARRAAGEAVGLATRDVVLYPVGAGGSFDSRLDHRIVREAAAIARALGRPVSLSYSRGQEFLTELPGAPARARITARPAPSGAIAAWHSRIAAPAAARQTAARLFDRADPAAAMEAAQGKVDPPQLIGAPPPYAIPHLALDAVPVDLGLPVGLLRGNGERMACFAAESFVDELALMAQTEPLSYRIGMLSGNARMGACLQGVAQLAGWDGGVAGLGQGLACWRMADPSGDPDGDGRIAVIAAARLGETGVEVSSLSAFCDIGRIIHHDLAMQQIEGGLIYGMMLALGAAGSWDGGLPRHRTLGDLRLPPLARAPEITVGFVASDAPPFDPGEIGVVAVAPAIANALHAASGRRYRTLPIDPAGENA